LEYSLHNLMRVMRPYVKKEPQNKAISAHAPIDLLIQGLQERSWRANAIDDRLADPTFPYSGLFNPPKQIEEDIAYALALAGLVVGRPIVSPQPLTTPYQEKLSPPFVYAAWYRLENVSTFPNNLALGKDVFIATAPTGKIYPVTYSEAISRHFAIVFDANLLLFYRIVLTSIARICFCPDSDRQWKDPAGVKWGRNFRMDKSLEEILQRTDDYTNIASLMLNIVVQLLPYSENFHQFEPEIKQQILISMLIDDLYTYVLAHEIGHIILGHFSEKKRTEEPTTKGPDIGDEERAADIYGFAMLANTIDEEAGNFRVYINTSIVFHVMAFVYRSVHLIHFHQDYEHLPPQVLTDMYFPPTDYYPHPLARLFALRREVRDKARSVPADIDWWDKTIDSFFENLWKPVCLRMAPTEMKVSPMWNDVVDVHLQAYAAIGRIPKI
jgi:hypothetical protein